MIVQVHAHQVTDQPIEHARREHFVPRVVALALPAADDVEAFVKFGEQVRDFRRVVLQVAVERTKPGASITYSVCTISRAENEDVIDALGLPVEDLGAEFPDFRHPRRPEFLLTLPHAHRTSGFFVARLRRP